jgi:hypothetical protein
MQPQGGNWYNEIRRNYNEIPRLTEYQLKIFFQIFKKKTIFFQKNDANEKSTPTKNIIVALNHTPDAQSDTSQSVPLQYFKTSQIS